MQKHAGNEKSLVWLARDFADDELKDELFYIQFASIESFNNNRKRRKSKAHHHSHLQLRKLQYGLEAGMWKIFSSKEEGKDGSEQEKSKVISVGVDVQTLLQKESQPMKLAGKLVPLLWHMQAEAVMKLNKERRMNTQEKELLKKELKEKNEMFGGHRRRAITRSTMRYWVVIPRR